MGLLQSITDWNKARQERHVSTMKDKGDCPQCYGKGFHAYPGHEFSFYTASLDCPGCDGSGLYVDWELLS
ncbi:methionine aminopeptidase [Bacillus sp. BGMRC 2118]|nr:methionine aminopeptidase [Bacillus sp. BGMRC 2118]